MNDTPRTDAAWKALPSVYDFIVEMKRMERELNAANKRIKRLEEVGDEMLNWLTDDGISMENLRLIANAWRKAKEDKP